MSETPKPSEEYVVIRHRRGYRLRRTLILLGFTIVAAISGYMAGMAQGGFRFSSAEETKELLVHEVDNLREQYHSARQQLRSNREEGKK